MGGEDNPRSGCVSRVDAWGVSIRVMSAGVTAELSSPRYAVGAEVGGGAIPRSGWVSKVNV